MSSRFDIATIADTLDRFLYRKAYQVLSKRDLETADRWTRSVIRQNHPDWDDEQVERYFHSLLNVRVSVVDEWGRRMQ